MTQRNSGEPTRSNAAGKRQRWPQWLEPIPFLVGKETKTQLIKKEMAYVKEIDFVHCYVEEPGGANYRQPENRTLLEQRPLRRVSRS